MRFPTLLKMMYFAEFQCFMFISVFPNLFLASAPFSDKQISIAPYHP